MAAFASISLSSGIIGVTIPAWDQRHTRGHTSSGRSIFAAVLALFQGLSQGGQRCQTIAYSSQAARPPSGFSPEKGRELYSIPATAEAVAAITLGYLGGAQALPEDLRERELTPRIRKPLQEFVFGGQWGHTAPWVQG